MASHRFTQGILQIVRIGVVFGLLNGGRAAETAQAQSVISQPCLSTPIGLELQREIRFTPWELVTAVAWSPDGAVLAVAAGNSLDLYQTESWEPVVRIEVGALTHGLAFSADGVWLAAGSRDGDLRLWELAKLLAGGDRAPTRTLVAHRKGVNDLRFSPDGVLLASGGNDAIARFWDPASGNLLGMTIGGSFAVPSIDFSPDGKTLAVVNGPVIRLREVGTERIVGTFQSEAPLHKVAFSPDGSLLAASGNDNLIRVWKTAEAYRTANPVYPEPLLLRGHAGTAGTFRALVWRIVFSPDGRRLASAGGDGTLRLWDPITGELIASCAAHPHGVADISFRKDGNVIASGGLDGSVKIWKVMAGRAGQ